MLQGALKTAKQAHEDEQAGLKPLAEARKRQLRAELAWQEGHAERIREM